MKQSDSSFNLRLDNEQQIKYKVSKEDFRGKIAQSDKEITETIPPYLASEELEKAIEYASLLKRPLLIRGEPGCGKTRIAQVLAFNKYGNDYRKKYFEWNIKSTTKAIDGLYQFDYLNRLQDAELRKLEPGNEEKYRKLGPLGKAFINSTREAPSVLLIDEIDKADIDFPNDLLLELDQKRFSISETGEEIIAEEAPIVIITSNDEKELPSAFLRRCVFHYIEFPKEEMLNAIITAHLKSFALNNPLPEDCISDIVSRFNEKYNEMKVNSNTDKLVSTSELLDWVKLIYYYYSEGKLMLTSENKLPNTIPYPEILFKTLNDYKQFYVK